MFGNLYLTKVHLTAEGDWIGRVILSGFIRFKRWPLRKSVCGLVFLLAVETYRTVIGDQLFRNAMVGKLYLDLSNYRLCLLPVNFN